MKLPSDIHETLSSIDNTRRDTLVDSDRRLVNADRVHKFINGRDFLSVEEQNEQGIREIVNFGSTLRQAQTWLAPLEAITISNPDLIDIEFRTNLGPTIDTQLSEAAEEAVNPLISRSNKFDVLMRSIYGEGYIRGGVPVTYEYEDEGVFPDVSDTLILPHSSSLISDEIPYAFEEIEVDAKSLKDLLELDADYVNKQGIKQLIEEIRQQIRQHAENQYTDETEVDLESARESGDYFLPEVISIKGWRYWEVRVDEKTGDQYVSKIEYVDRYQVSGHEDVAASDSFTPLIMEEKAFEDASMWLEYLVFDEEIGGKKRADTIRGIGEIIYRPSRAIEELKNRRFEGALMSSIPTLIENELMDPEEVKDFQLGVDTFAPKGFTKDSVLALPDFSRNLDPIIHDLANTVSGTTAGDRANTGRGQELRQQALERQQNSRQITSVRIMKAYKHLDCLFAGIFHRLMTLSPPKGSADYSMIKRFQYCFDMKIVEIMRLDLEDTTDDAPVPQVPEIGRTYSDTIMKKAAKFRKELAEKIHGYHKYMQVKANRLGSGIDPDQETEMAQFLMEFLNSGNVDPQLAGQIRKIIVLLRTGRTDIAKLISQDIEPMKKDQVHVASTEWDVITRRATIGQVYPVNAFDVHETHVLTHLDDAIATVNAHGVRPWDQLSVIQITAAFDHVGQHLQIMGSQPQLKGRMAEIFPQFQQVVKQVGLIIQEVQQQQEQAQEPDMNDPDTVLKMAQAQKVQVETELMLRKFGIEIAEKDRLSTQSNIRAVQNGKRLQIMERSALVNETLKNRQLRLQEQNMMKSTNENQLPRDTTTAETA